MGSTLSQVPAKCAMVNSCIQRYILQLICCRYNRDTVMVMSAVPDPEGVFKRTLVRRTYINLNC